MPTGGSTPTHKALKAVIDHLWAHGALAVSGADIDGAVVGYPSEA